MGRRFLAERRRDPYYRAAQEEGLHSRAAFKLAELNDEFRLLHPGDRVLDLGAAPGGWSVVAADAVGPEGAVLAVDERRTDPIEGVESIRGRVGSEELRARLAGCSFEVVLSDLSPRISGAYSTDHARSVDLVRTAFALARPLLQPGGHFVAKVFDGDLRRPLERELKRHFASLHRTKPAASRERSSELYLLCLGFRPPRTTP
ncbi:MAG: RlmE family RNA methyltransferase [Thermoplasmata archaeon]|nr:RlmE family RNA methyltransferase [Thermoplasmata archaeon]MCI4338105.1 RlmE family RNA methyltransferase [Thermoplasmata archaeon]MCI4341772.1 RlmE family RNA methyltransferase [Thermoplasmata archaeon]